jgi:hypothetical protein
MNQTTVERVLGWLAQATGKDAVCDREMRMELMNDIRQPRRLDFTAQSTEYELITLDLLNVNRP